MSAQLPAKHRVCCAHFGGNIGIAGLPHHWCSTQGTYRVGQDGTTFYIKDHRPLTSGKQVACQDNQVAIRPDNRALVVYNAEPVAVAIQGNPQIGCMLLYRGTEILQILRFEWIGMMVREATIGFNVEGNNLSACRFQRPERDGTGDTVATVQHHARLALSVRRNNCGQRQ